MITTATPPGFSTVNPFFITRDADGLIAFLREVFGGEEHLDARTVDIDGLLLHAELEVGGTTLMFGERKPNWPFLPQLTQIYVGDVESVLARAEERGCPDRHPTDRLLRDSLLPDARPLGEHVVGVPARRGPGPGLGCRRR